MAALDKYVSRLDLPSSQQQQQKPPLGFAMGTVIDLTMTERAGNYGPMKSYIIHFALDYGHPAVVKSDGTPFILKDTLDNRLYVDKETALSARLRAMFPGITHERMSKLTHVAPILGLKFYLYLVDSVPREIGGPTFTNVGLIEPAHLALNKPVGVFPSETYWIDLINRSGLPPTMTVVQLPAA